MAETRPMCASSCRSRCASRSTCLRESALAKTSPRSWSSLDRARPAPTRARRDGAEHEAAHDGPPHHSGTATWDLMPSARQLRRSTAASSGKLLDPREADDVAALDQGGRPRELASTSMPPSIAHERCGLAVPRELDQAAAIDVQEVDDPAQAVLDLRDRSRRSTAPLNVVDSADRSFSKPQALRERELHPLAARARWRRPRSAGAAAPPARPTTPARACTASKDRTPSTGPPARSGSDTCERVPTRS